MMHDDEPLDDLHAEESEESTGPALVTCAICGHPNLAFRNHCRRCGTTLVGATNLLPGIDRIEWTPTDGPERRDKQMSQRFMLLFLVVCVAVPVGGLVAAQMRSPAAGVALLLVAVMFAGTWLLRSRPEGTSRDEDTGAREEPPRCHACGEETDACDDICAGCGALVAPDYRE
jgi:hypothetical protein